MPGAADRFRRRVYDELRRAAPGKMALERPGGTPPPTALVHQTWLRLGADQQPTWQNRAAKALDISDATAKRRWAFARAWLQRELGE